MKYPEQEELIEDLFSYESFMTKSQWTYTKSMDKIFKEQGFISNSQYGTCLKMLDELKEQKAQFRGDEIIERELCQELDKPRPFAEGWTFNAKDYE